MRAVFLLGFSEGQFPARVSEDAVLGDDERLRLEKSGVEMGRTRSRRLLDERLLAYVAVTRAGEHLWVSYPAADERGRPMEPSPYWPALQAALRDDAPAGRLPGAASEAVAQGGAEASPIAPPDGPDPHGASNISTVSRLAAVLAERMRAWCENRLPAEEAEPWLRLYDWARREPGVRPQVAAALSAFAPPTQARLDEQAVGRLWPPPFHTSVTRLEQFAACPFRHHAAYGLRLAERAEHEVSSLDLGRLYHRILEGFVDEMIDGGLQLKDLSAADIAERLGRWSELALTEETRRLWLEPPVRRASVRRSRQELSPAVEGGQASLGRSPLTPLATEVVFGEGPAADLPGLRLTTPDGAEVLVRGKIDRVDVLPGGSEPLAVVFDYKRQIGRRLRLDEVYHGLALQLLAYLLVLRDHGDKLDGRTLTPAGALYLPLLGNYARLDHPSEVDDENFDPFKTYRPRGVIDFDWIAQLDPSLQQGWSRVFSAFKSKDGALGNIEKSDAVTGGALIQLLDHVRREMASLAGRWLSGDIAVRPFRLGDQVPCVNCAYRSVCRIEYSTRQTRRLPLLGRREVLDRLAHVEPASAPPEELP